MTPAEFLTLKNTIAKLDKDYQREIGSHDALMKRLKDDLDCTTVEEALIKREELKASKDRLKAKHATKLTEFERDWKQKLEELK